MLTTIRPAAPAHDENRGERPDDRPDDHPGEELLGLADLRPADVIMVRGSSVLSSFLRSMDRSEYDHIVLVVSVDLDREILTVADQSFFGFRHFDVANYEERPDRLLVRRHRVSGGEDVVVKRVLEYGSTNPCYDKYALVTIVQDTVRHLPTLLENSTSAAAGRLVSAIARVLTASPERSIDPAGVCVDPILFAFDCVDPTIPHSPYFGLSFPFEQRNGLGEWLASWRAFDEAARTMGAYEPDRLCLALLQTIDGSSPIDANRDGLVRALAALVQPNDDSATAENQVLACLALSLLDRTLRQRVVVTPDDILRTPSLFDVGHLDTSVIRWAN